MNSGPTIVAFETDSAWVVILAVSLVTLVVVGVLQRAIRRPGGFASGALLVLPLVLPLVAAVVYQQAVLPEISVLKPPVSALSDGSGSLLHLLLVANEEGKGFTLYALSGSAGPWVLLFGLLMSSFMVVRRIIGRIALRRLVARSSQLPPELGTTPTRIARRMAAAAGLAQTPEILVLPPGAVGAFATGGREPRILISGQLLDSLETAELEAVIAHEIAHIKALDVRLVAVAGFLRDAVAWNPFAHLAYRRLLRQRELEADRRAAQMTHDPLAVASGLVKMCELLRATGTRRRHALAFLSPRTRIRSRVSALLQMSDAGIGAVRAPTTIPYALAGVVAIALGLTAGAQLASNEGAWAITFGSPMATETERWRDLGSLDVPKAGEAPQGKAAERLAARIRRQGQPAVLKPFSQVAISVTKRDFPELKRELRRAARRRGFSTPALFSRGWLDYEAVEMISDSDGGIGLYRIHQLQ